jgi:hypothetical protein
MPCLQDGDRPVHTDHVSHMYTLFHYYTYLLISMMIHLMPVESGRSPYGLLVEVEDDREGRWRSISLSPLNLHVEHFTRQTRTRRSAA